MAREPQRREQPADGVSFYFANEDAELVARERDKHMAIMRGIPRRRAELAEAERDLVRYARLLGIGWDDIAEAIAAAPRTRLSGSTASLSPARTRSEGGRR